MEARGYSTMTYGNACVCRNRNSRSNSRNNFEFHIRVNKFKGFFTTSTEYERIATLKAGDYSLRILPCKLYEQLVDFGLLDLMVRRHLAHIHHLCIGIAHRKDCRRNETVINHHVGTLKDFFATQRQEPRIARTCTNQEHLSKIRHH